MGLRFRKTFNYGPLKTNLSKKGIGSSLGFFGFRFGTTSEGRRYWSFGLKGTGLYYIKYF